MDRLEEIKKAREGRWMAGDTYFGTHEGNWLISEVERLRKENEGLRSQIKATDNILATYGKSDVPLLHDRVFKVISKLQLEKEWLLTRCAKRYIGGMSELEGVKKHITKQMQ